MQRPVYKRFCTVTTRGSADIFHCSPDESLHPIRFVLSMTSSRHFLPTAFTQCISALMDWDERRKKRHYQQHWHLVVSWLQHDPPAAYGMKSTEEEMQCRTNGVNPRSEGRPLLGLHLFRGSCWDEQLLHWVLLWINSSFHGTIEDVRNLHIQENIEKRSLEYTDLYHLYYYIYLFGNPDSQYNICLLKKWIPLASSWTLTRIFTGPSRAHLQSML